MTPAGRTRLLKVKIFYGDTKSVFNILSTAKGKCVQQENDIVLHIVSVFKGDFWKESDDYRIYELIADFFFYSRPVTPASRWSQTRTGGWLMTAIIIKSMTFFSFCLNTLPADVVVIWLCSEFFHLWEQFLYRSSDNWNIVLFFLSLLFILTLTHTWFIRAHGCTHTHSNIHSNKNIKIFKHHLFHNCTFSATCVVSKLTPARPWHCCSVGVVGAMSSIIPLKTPRTRTTTLVFSVVTPESYPSRLSSYLLSILCLIGI